MSFLQKEISLSSLSLPKLPRRSQGDPGRARRSGTRRHPSGGKHDQITGLEIGATRIIAAEGRLQDGRIVAQRIASREIPVGLVREGVITDAEALARELQALFSEERLGRRVRVGLATPRTILRVIDLPPLSEADIPVALKMQAQDRIPMPLDRAVLDHQTIGLVDTPEGPRMRVVVVATERTTVEVLLDALRRANLRPVGIDLSVFAAIRAVAEPEESTEPMLYAQLGDLVNVAIAEAGVCLFTRQAPQGLAYVLERLAELREISVEDAEVLLARAAGDGVSDELTDPDDARAVGALLGGVAGELGSELRAAAEFYGTQSGLSVRRGVVTGPLVALRGFVPALADASGLELRAGEVAAEDGALSGLDPRTLPVAVGLSVGSLQR